MSHELESGASTIRPWHFEQTKHDFTINPDGWLTAKDMFMDGGVDWDVRSSPTLIGDPRNPFPGTRHNSLYKSTALLTEEPLSIMRASYHPFTNAQMVELAQFMVDNYECSLDSVTSLREGRIITVTLFFPRPYTVPGDNSETYEFFNIVNSHDGSRALGIFLATLRIICKNTEAVADAQSRRHGYRFTRRHTKQVVDMTAILAEVNELMLRSVESLDRRKEESFAIAESMPVNRELFLEQLFPIVDEESKIHRTHVMKKRSQVIGVLNTDTIADQYNPWQLHQAVVEFDEHIAPRRSEDRRKEVILGGGTDLSRRSFALIKEMTGVR